jgi:hypothetical protein
MEELITELADASGPRERVIEEYVGSIETGTGRPEPNRVIHEQVQGEIERAVPISNGQGGAFRVLAVLSPFSNKAPVPQLDRLIWPHGYFLRKTTPAFLCCSDGCRLKTAPAKLQQNRLPPHPCFLRGTFNRTIQTGEHVIPNRGILRIVVSKWIPANPLDNDLGRVEQLLVLSPLNKRLFHAQVLAGVTKQNHSPRRDTIRQSNSNNVP